MEASTTIEADLEMDDLNPAVGDVNYINAHILFKEKSQVKDTQQQQEYTYATIQHRNHQPDYTYATIQHTKQELEAIKDQINISSSDKKSQAKSEGRKRCLVVAYPEEESQSAPVCPVPSTPPVPPMHAGPSMPHVPTASSMLCNRTGVIKYTAVTIASFCLFCAVYFPIMYGGHPANNSENNLSEYTPKQDTGYNNTRSNLQDTMYTMETVNFNSQMKNKKKKTTALTSTQSILTTNFLTFQQTIKKMETSLLNSRWVQEKTKKSIMKSITPSIISTKLPNTKLWKLKPMQKKNSNQGISEESSKRKKYSQCNQADFTQLIRAKKLTRNLKIEEKVVFRKKHIKYIRNRLWIFGKSLIHVYSPNGEFVHTLRKFSSIRNICQTYTGDIIASDKSHVVKYSTISQKWLTLFKVKLFINDVSTHECKLSVMFGKSREIQTYRQHSSGKGWKLQASLILDNPNDYIKNCKFMVHNNMIFLYNCQYSLYLYQFSKEGHYVRRSYFVGHPEGIDRNGWLLNFLYHIYKGLKIGVYNSTSLKLHKHLKLDPVTHIHMTPTDSVVDDDGNIWVLTGNALVKYTV